MDGETNEKYASQWIESELLPIGGKWVYIVGIIADHTGERKVRIAKGPLKSPGDKVPAQVQRLNIKDYVEWEKLTPLVKKFLRQTRKQADKTGKVNVPSGHDTREKSEG